MTGCVGQNGTSPVAQRPAVGASPAALATYLRTTEGITRAELKRARRKVFENPVLASPGFAKAACKLLRNARK